VATKNPLPYIDLSGVCWYHKPMKTKGGSM
jgi:hypothetical protein